MSGAMLSYLTNFPLADRLRRMKLSVKRIFTRGDPVFSPDINWGDRVFNRRSHRSAGEVCWST